MDLRHQFRPATSKALAAEGHRLALRPSPRLIAGLALLGLAAALALLAALLASRWLDREASRRAGKLAAPAPMTEVWLVKAPLAAGTAFSVSSVRKAGWPAAAVPGAAIPTDPARLRALAGRRLAVDVPEGALLLEGHFMAPGAGGALAHRLARGMRAITVPVTASSGLSGLVQPGDRVDLLFSGTLPDGRPISETVLADVRVLGLDRQLDASFVEAGAGPAVPGTVTLEVTPESAEAIAFLAEAGRLSLALRASEPLANVAGGLAPSVPAAATLLARLATAVRTVEAPSASASAPPAAPPAAPGAATAPDAAMAALPGAALPASTREGGVAVVRGSSIRSAGAAPAPASGAAP